MRDKYISIYSKKSAYITYMNLALGPSGGESLSSNILRSNMVVSWKKKNTTALILL